MWQATVERGFSVNKELLAPNLQETQFGSNETCTQLNAGSKM